jgi:hypothetical protein
MKALFSYGDPHNPFDFAIMEATGSVVHAALLLDDDRLLDIHHQTGVRLLDSGDVEYPDLADEAKWLAVPLPWQQTPQLVAFCSHIVGMPYDVLGLIAAVTGNGYYASNAYFCSRGVHDAITRAAPPPDLGRFDAPNPAQLLAEIDCAMGKTATVRSKPANLEPLQNWLRQTLSGPNAKRVEAISGSWSPGATQTLPGKVQGGFVSGPFSQAADLLDQGKALMASGNKAVDRVNATCDRGDKTFDRADAVFDKLAAALQKLAGG